MSSFTCYDITKYRPNSGVELKNGEIIQHADLTPDERKFVDIWILGGDQQYADRFEISQWDDFLSNDVPPTNIAEFKGEDGFFAKYRRRTTNVGVYTQTHKHTQTHTHTHTGRRGCGVFGLVPEWL
jgi:hypothetical protein